jgi:ubiquinone/menaquinone biosynthesis C-methylase UbiE
MDRSRPEFAELQRCHFEDAEVERFRWTTEAPGFAETEDELLAPLLALMESPCLEVGCGEGNNLLRLSRVAHCVGVDLFPRKLQFASHELPQTGLAAGEGGRLPFRDASFRSIFIRDLLHHVSDPHLVLEEATRVLATGGALCLLEPNARNPLVRLQTHLVAAEAGARESTLEHISQLLEHLPIEELELRTRLPLPLRRLVLHYRLGLPVLGRIVATRQALALGERALARLVPSSHWSYIVATARRG